MVFVQRARQGIGCMTAHEAGAALELSRRQLLAAAGIGAGALAMPAQTRADAAVSDPVGGPPVAGLHLQFGADASSEVTVSWHALQPVRHPRVLLGRLDGKLEQIGEA